MFRLDRFLTLYFFHSLARRQPSLVSKVPILMYHGISGPKKKSSHPYYETSTTQAVFSRQMGFLKVNGYRVIGLNELMDIFASPEYRYEKRVVITFDDGLLDFCTTGFSILKNHGFSATVFLPSGLMGKELAGQPVMSWQDARDLDAEGVAFGSHSVSHRKLAEVEVDELENEIRLSKEKIESELGKRITSFSYPYAFPAQSQEFAGHLENLLIETGYKTGVTTTIGMSSRNDRRLLLKRLPINDHDDIPFFKAKLEGGYDWLSAPQILMKKLKSQQKVSFSDR